MWHPRATPDSFPAWLGPITIACLPPITPSPASMNPVPMQCPLCAGTIQVDPAYAGQQVACPLCQGVMVLPPPEFFGLPSAGGGFPPEPPGFAPPSFPPQFPQEAQQLPQLGCPVCGGAFQVSPQMVGQQMACPHCHN